MNRFPLKLSYSSRKYVPELDGTRGIAILLVILYHCFPCVLTGIGWVGVDLFFVLSGFLITGILLDTKGSNKYYFNFIVRRVLRIFPLYYLVLFIIFILVPALWKAKLPHDFIFYLHHQGWFWSYLQNWLFSIHGYPENRILTHFWSLAVEEQFYLVWPLIILFMSDRYLLRLSILLCGIAIIFRLLPLGWFHFDTIYRYVNTISRMDALLIGAIIAQLIKKNIRILEKIAIPVGVAGLIIFLVGIYISFDKILKPDNFPAFYTAIDLFMGMIIILSFSNIKWIRSILRYPLLAFLGKYSYGIYVYHLIIQNILIYAIRRWSIVHFSSFSQRVLILGPLTIILSILISLLSYHLFEVHFLKLKSYFRNDVRKRDDKTMKTRLLEVSD